MSKLQGPVGQRGFSRSQGPVGPAGPRGFNETQGIQGVIGSQGINGSQGPPGRQGPNGAGDFSQCEHKTKKLIRRQAPITSNSLLIPTNVILGEPSVSKFIRGVSKLSLMTKCLGLVVQLVCLILTQMNSWVLKCNWRNMPTLNHACLHDWTLQVELLHFSLFLSLTKKNSP